MRPVRHQKMERIEAHIVLEKFCTVPMGDVHLPTTDGRTVILTRHTPPEKELPVLREQRHLTLPAQPPPKIHAPAAWAVQ